MANKRKQTRRTVSMTVAVYETVRAAALARGVSMSEIVESMVVKFATPEAVAEELLS